jgi:hypothetical protein
MNVLFEIYLQNMIFYIIINPGKTRAFLDLSIDKPKNALYHDFCEKEGFVPLQSGGMAVDLKYYRHNLQSKIVPMPELTVTGETEVRRLV